MAAKEFAVFGLGRFGRSVALALMDAGCEVLVVDRKDEIVTEMADLVTYAVNGNITNQEVVKSLGISNYDGVVVAIGSDMESSVMATILAKEMGIPFVLAKAKTDIHGRILKSVGADKIVFPEKETGIRIGNQLAYGNYFDAIELADHFSIMELDLPEEWDGQTLKTLNLRANYNVNAIGIKRNDQLSVNPNPNMELLRNDVLVVIGENETLNLLIKLSMDSKK